jgi:2-polyprenyl-6-methoxyphenol hydroxylase-like FAD-dependent oxidoreductase
MASKIYDAVVVGARVAGSPTAMLLARKGYDVLLVDRATFPSDTVSTHLVHPPGIEALERWGLLDSLVATGCPAIDTYVVDFGPFTLAGAPDGATVAYGPRRTLLDKLLVDAAAQSGAEVRESFSVESIICENDRVMGVRGHGKGGGTVSEHARMVIGADGRHSLVAQAINAQQYNEKPPLLAGYYAYWSGLPMEGRFETYVRPNRGMAAWPTNDDLTVVIAGWPYAEFEANKKDIEGNFFKTTISHRPLRNGCGPAPGKLGLWVRRCRTTSASLTVRVGHSSATPHTTRTSLPRRESTMRSGMPNSASRLWTRHSAGLAPSKPPWPSTRPVVTSVCWRCMSSPQSSQPWSRRRPNCSSCWLPWPATKRPWMGSHESTPA